MVAHVALALFLAMVPAQASALTEADIDAAAPAAARGLKAIVRRLAGDPLRGRDNGTPESDRAQVELIHKLRRAARGALPGEVGDAAFRQPFVRSNQIGTNILAVIPGRELPNEYVIVGGHYDHLDTRSGPSGACSTGRLPGGQVCNGATDNASGTAVVLGVANAMRKLPTPPRRSVVFALWDAEEDGLVGSLHYVNAPVVPLAHTVAYVNLDIQGAVLLPSLRHISFAVGAETGGSVLGAFVNEAIRDEQLATQRLSYIFGQLRSDYANFGSAGVPTVFFSDSTGGCYHTVGDDVSVVDFRKLAQQARIAFRTTVGLAEADERPTFHAPNMPLATYADAVAVQRVFAIGSADAHLLTPADQAIAPMIAAELGAIVAAGPDAFDDAALTTVLNATLQGVGAIARVPCQRF